MRAVPWFRNLAKSSLANATALFVRFTWRWLYKRSLKHELPGSLCITLTSYPPRFATLALTLMSLLSQSTRPNQIELWIAIDDLDRLPEDVLRLQSRGILIRPCADLKSYKKIIPSLILAEHKFLIIADDDMFYYRHWVRDLSRAYRPGTAEVICTRARRIRFNSDSSLKRYMDWDTDIEEGSVGKTIFPTGIGGVLYAKDIFHKDVTRVDLFQKLCPTADDIWLYWMAAMNGANFRKVGPRKREITWAATQLVALFETNRTANDEQISNMISHYGFPTREK